MAKHHLALSFATADGLIAKNILPFSVSGWMHVIVEDVSGVKSGFKSEAQADLALMTSCIFRSVCFFVSDGHFPGKVNCSVNSDRF